MKWGKQLVEKHYVIGLQMECWFLKCLCKKSKVNLVGWFLRNEWKAELEASPWTIFFIQNPLCPDYSNRETSLNDTYQSLGNYKAIIYMIRGAFILRSPSQLCFGGIEKNWWVDWIRFEFSESTPQTKIDIVWFRYRSIWELVDCNMRILHGCQKVIILDNEFFH